MRSVAVVRRMRDGLCAIGVLGALIAAKSPPALEPLRDEDGLFSLNVSCPVRGGRLNPNFNMYYVNRHPVGFC